MKVKYLFILVNQYLISVIVIPALFILFDIRIRLKGRIYFKGASVYASNHRTWFDPPILGVFIQRAVSIIAKKELFSNPLMSLLIRGLGAFPVNRQALDMASIKRMSRVLEDGKSLLIFPEGTRSRTNEVKEGKAGVGFILNRNKESSVVPVRIIIEEKGTLGRKRFNIIFGGGFCINYSLLNEIKDKKERYAAITRIVTENIRRLG